MSKRYALALLLGLAGCHRGSVADVTLDADRAAENATAAKTIADLAAADKAAAVPMPRREPVVAPTRAPTDSDTADAPDGSPSEANDADVSRL